MRLVLLDSSCVRIDLRATGLLRAVGHDPTLCARVPAIAIDVSDEAAIDVPVEARFDVNEIDLPRDLPPGDREKMRENMLSREVLDAARFAAIDFRGRYTGSLDAGTLAGDLVVRGAPRVLSMDVRVDREAARFAARGSWEGRLTQLGVKPFKALLGALKLDDWIRIRVDARFERVDA